MSVRCHGITRRGERCKNKTLEGEYCYHHKIKEYESPKKTILSSIRSLKEETDVEEPPECCICTEYTDDLLACQHSVCVSCATQLGKAECPACRSYLKGPSITQDIYEIIRERNWIRGKEDEEIEILKLKILEKEPDLDINLLYGYDLNRLTLLLDIMELEKAFKVAENLETSDEDLRGILDFLSGGGEDEEVFYIL